MECVYLIEETIISPNGSVYEKSIVCAALNEEEAKHKVKYLNENVVVKPTYEGYRVAYDYKPVSLETRPSWLFDLKKG
ncbi:hypothetical protein JC221_057 [Yersinia phage JC221]|nr:hypothetical protein JC221_057 [Yersinia phage JC221]